MKNIFVKNRSDNLREKILNKLSRYNVCVLKNFVNEDKVCKIFNILKKINKNKKDIRLSGKFFYKMNDYKRLDIGECYTNPRFARFILCDRYCPLQKIPYLKKEDAPLKIPHFGTDYNAIKE